MAARAEARLDGPVGLVGCGLLGSAVAGRLTSSGFKVIAHDVSRAAVEGITQAGLAAGKSLDELAARCHLVVVCVYSAEQVMGVLEEVAGAGHRVTFLCSTTLDPEAAVRSARLASESAVDFIEFPVSGTATQVAKGEALGLLGGEEARIAEHEAIITAITPRTVRIGPVGSAAKAKLAINLILELNRSAVAEGLVFAERMGLDLESFESVLLESTAYSRVMDEKLPKMRDGDFRPEARARQSLKDVKLMLATAESHHQRLPLTQVHAGLLRDCVGLGWGDLDGTVVIEALRQLKHSEEPAHLGAGHG